MLSAAFITPLPGNRIPNKLGPNGPYSILRNCPSCSFASFLIVSLTLFIDKPNFSNYLTILMISFISSFVIINVVVPDPNVF